MAGDRSGTLVRIAIGVGTLASTLIVGALLGLVFVKLFVPRKAMGWDGIADALGGLMVGGLVGVVIGGVLIALLSVRAQLVGIAIAVVVALIIAAVLAATAPGRSPSSPPGRVDEDRPVAVAGPNGATPGSWSPLRPDRL
jgi:hypothetical protein